MAQTIPVAGGFVRADQIASIRRKQAGIGIYSDYIIITTKQGTVHHLSETFPIEESGAEVERLRALVEAAS
jgi:hypothetical protein